LNTWAWAGVAERKEAARLALSAAPRPIGDLSESMVGRRKGVVPSKYYHLSPVSQNSPAHVREPANAALVAGGLSQAATGFSRGWRSVFRPCPAAFIIGRRGL